MSTMNKQRKFLLVLPLLVIPFLTMAFWALGGGSAPASGQPTAAHGIDVTLPQAQFKKEPSANKMSVYQAALRDSAQNGVSPSFLNSVAEKPAADQSADRIQAKLAQLNQQLAQPAPSTYQPQDDQQISKLHRMVSSVRANRQEDPEMAQLSHMLSQLQAIQNPGSVKTKSKPTDTKSFKAIPAIIDGKQKVRDGGAVRLKLTDTVTIKDQALPKGQLLFGVCSVTNQRLLLTIQNIRLEKQIIPVSLTVFSLDGMPGIPAPEAELGGAAGNGADNALQSMQFLTMDQSLGAQAAAGGVNAAKSLFSKKIKKIKVKLKDEYPVLLKINK
jgi:hypothetical protein